MKRFLAGFFALLVGLSFTLAPLDADARRLGGGKSFGMQRAAPVKREAAPRQEGTPPSVAPQKRSWMGPIAGLAAGLGLAALMSHLGLGEGFANILLIALVILAAVMLLRWLMRPKAPAGLAYANAGNAPQVTQLESATPAASGSPAAASPCPPQFDRAAFEREAKLNFLRLQTAFDAGNLDDLRAFTTPEVFAELRLELDERGTAPQRTDVMALDAEVVDCAEENGQLIVSVRFHGLIRESADSGATPFEEIWHLAKPANGQTGWRVAGIQQPA